MRAIAVLGFLFQIAFSESGQTAELEFDKAVVTTVPADSREVAEKEISEYVSRLGVAVAAESVLRIVPMVDAEQMAEIIVAEIKNRRMADSLRNTFKTRLLGQLAAGVSRTVAGWDRHQLSRLAINKSLDLTTFTLRVWDQDGYSGRMECWLVRRKSGWKLYDFNDLAFGIRVTQTVKMTLGQLANEDTSFSEQDMRTLQIAMYSLHGEDFETADEQLRLVEKRKFPSLLESIKWALISIVAATLEDYERVLMALEQCDRIGQPFPIADYVRANAHNQLGNPELALEAADRFLKVFGPDADALYERGLALEALDRDDEALAAYRQGLDDTPGSAENLAGLGLLLPSDQTEEIATRFAASPHPASRFDDIAYEFLYEENMPALATLTAAMKKINPDDLYVPYYEAELAFSREEYPLASSLLGNALSKVDDEELQAIYLDRFLDASLLAKQTLAAYRQVDDKAYAFEYLVADLPGEDRDDELRTLIDAHREAFPNDPLTWYFTGELHYYNDDYEKADQAYARAAELEPDEYYAESITNSRVFCWYALGKGLEAYEQFKPDHVVFETLAELYFDDESFADLTTIIDRHRQVHGKSGIIVYWQSLSLWAQQKHADCVNAVLSDFDLVVAELEGWQLTTLGESVVRSLIRLDRTEEALPLFDRITELDDDPLNALLVHSALGHTDKTNALLDRCLHEGDWSSSELLDDEDLNRILQTKAGASIRSKLVRRFFDENREDAFVMLLKAPVEISAEQIKVAAKRLWSADFAITDNSQTFNSKDKPTIVDNGFGWFLIVNGEFSCSINTRDYPRCAHPETVAAEIRELRTQNLYRQHRAHVSITLAEKSTDAESWRMAARLLIELTADADPLLIEAPATTHLAIWDEDLKKGMLGENPVRAVQSINMVPVIVIDDDSPAMKKAIQTARDRWSEFTDAFANRTTGQRFSVKASFTDGDHREAMWISVSRIADGKVHGVLDSKPVNVSTIRYKEKTSVSAVEILDWLIVSADGKNLTGLFSREALESVE